MTVADKQWIVTLYYTFQDDENLYMIMEYCSGGDMMGLLIRLDIFTEKATKFFISEMILGISSLHKLGYIHRDLKPENLLLAERDKLDSIRIADFGLANQLDISNTLKSYCGTPGYIAPEIAMNKPYGDAVDMWSLGVIAYIL